MTALVQPLHPRVIGPVARAGERGERGIRLSFEFFPPKTEAMERTLWDAVARLAPLNPSFFSVTYGAGGSTRQRTHDTVVSLKERTGIDPAAHLTCVAATQGEIDDVARAYWDAGIRHVVALRGDPPGGMGGKYSPHPGGYANAAELIAGLKKIGAFQISAACYPEKHPDSADAKADLRTSSARSMPALTAASPSSSSRPTTSCASATVPRPRA